MPQTFGRLILPGFLIGSTIGLAESVALHYTSPAPFRDRFLFLIAVGLYGVAGTLGYVGIRLLLGWIRPRRVPR